MRAPVVSAPHEYVGAERTLVRLLDLMRGGRLPVRFLPLVNRFHTAVSEDPDSRCHVLALSHDEMGVLFDGLADPLEPVVAVALSSTCKGLRTPLRAGLEVLKKRHVRAADLCARIGCSCLALSRRCDVRLDGFWRRFTGLSANDMATMAMIMRTNALPRLLILDLSENGLRDADMQALFEGLGHGAAPLLYRLSLGDNSFRPAGAEALAAALVRGAMPKLVELDLRGNPISNQGVAALAAPLRKLPTLQELHVSNCEIGDEGVTSLVANLGKTDFKALWLLNLDGNKITDAGCARLVRTLKASAMSIPLLGEVVLEGNLASAAANRAVYDALAARRAVARQGQD